jgi:gluconolactonase
VIETLVDGLDHPEGVCWDPAAEVLWAGGKAGQVYRVELEAREAEEVARAPGFVLGLAVDGRGRVNRFDLETRELEEVTRLPGTVPDGVAFTADGGLLVACYRPDRIVHIDAAGNVEVVAEDPQGTLLAAPTNVAFAGADLERLVCASLGRWHRALVESGLRGAALHYPDTWAADA